MDSQFEGTRYGQLKQRYAAGAGAADRIFDACRRLGLTKCQLVFIPKTVVENDLVVLYEYLKDVVRYEGDAITFLQDVYGGGWLVGLLPLSDGMDEDTVYGRLQPDYGDIIGEPMVKDGSFYDMYHMTSDECDGIIPKVCCLGRWETLATD